LGVAPTTFVPPVGRVTPLDCVPAVAATLGEGTSVPVTCTLCPTNELTGVPESWYVVTGMPGAAAVAVADGVVPAAAVPATPVVGVVPPALAVPGTPVVGRVAPVLPVIVPVVPAVAPDVPVGTPVEAPVVVPVPTAVPVVPAVVPAVPAAVPVVGGVVMVLVGGTVVGASVSALDNMKGADAVLPAVMHPFMVMVCWEPVEDGFVVVCAASTVALAATRAALSSDRICHSPLRR